MFPRVVRLKGHRLVGIVRAAWERVAGGGRKGKGRKGETEKKQQSKGERRKGEDREGRG